VAPGAANIHSVRATTERHHIDTDYADPPLPYQPLARPLFSMPLD